MKLFLHGTWIWISVHYLAPFIIVNCPLYPTAVLAEWA